MTGYSPINPSWHRSLWTGGTRVLSFLLWPFAFLVLATCKSGFWNESHKRLWFPFSATSSPSFCFCSQVQSKRRTIGSSYRILDVYKCTPISFFLIRSSFHVNTLNLFFLSLCTKNYSLISGGFHLLAALEMSLLKTAIGWESTFQFKHNILSQTGFMTLSLLFKVALLIYVLMVIILYLIVW